MRCRYRAGSSDLKQQDTFGRLEVFVFQVAV
jgi:hypothetical protein